MSVCTFIASDYPLAEVVPTQDYPMEINVDTGMIYDGGADDNYFLLAFRDVADYTDKKYGVYLEWNYTEGRAEQILNYIRAALENTELVELWHVWLMDCYEYEDSPVIHKQTISIGEMTIRDIFELDNADIWNSPDKHIPSRPSFYCLKVTR
ncbi:MAG: hypothetical protein E7291_01315 [Lachnospiraceae bacterium]|nr:hypothetical protein [Lachnospiraceae bacterium]